MRQAVINRKTTETDISLELTIGGPGACAVDTGCGFLDHMLTLFARHGGFGLSVKCSGDIWVDDHHTVEDVGMCLGAAFSEALGDMRGITRYGSAIIPMDEALILTAVDISGRGVLVYDMAIPSQKVGSFDTELVEEFLRAFTRKACITVHVKQLAGSNSHHIIEGCFKSLARSLKAAVAIDEAGSGSIPSTKGVLA